MHLSFVLRPSQGISIYPHFFIVVGIGQNGTNEE
jgi:hypothetical protein